MSEQKQKKPQVKAGYAIAFFVVLGILTVVSFIIPLRPTRSQSEKRNLAQFPELTLEGVVSGTYFDEINIWFSDTFPGRETWLSCYAKVKELHGYSSVAISDDFQLEDQVEEIPDVETTPVTLPVIETDPVEETQEQVIIQEIAPPTGAVEEWGGIQMDANAEVSYGNSLIQVNDTVFTFCRFSEVGCNRYADVLNVAAATLIDKDVRLVNIPIPTSIGIIVENDHLEELNCTPQDEIIEYMFSRMHDSIIKLNLHPILVEHNDEYLYFRTDHHWTARGAYYAYVEICNTLGYEALPLEDFTEWDMGEFEGSNYWSAPYPSKLTIDNLYAYVPEGDIQMLICPDGRSGYEWPLLYDKTNGAPNTKYMTFLSGDHALSIVTNDSLPDGPTCAFVKDSYGNALVPFLTQIYHKVYVIDYRKYFVMDMDDFVDQYDVDDLIVANNLNAAQTLGALDELELVFR